MRRALAVAIGLARVACGCSAGGPPIDAPPPRTLDARAVVAGTGRSGPVIFEVPPATRCLAITVTGAPAALLGLAELTLADGVDRVALPAGAPGPAMLASYREERVGVMPGALYQAIRLGEQSVVYPTRPGDELPAGPARLRIASDAPGQVAVRVVMPPDDGAAALAINVIVVSDTLAVDASAVVDDAGRYLAAAGLSTRLGQTLRLPGTPYARITDDFEPQEPPTSPAAQLPALVRDALGDAPGVDVFVVEHLPAAIAGLALGTPGPAERRDHVFYGVVVQPTSAGVSGRVVAHEVAHFLGLQHVENTGASGAVYPDPLADTAAGADNLMAVGNALTADQGWVLRRSPQLQTR